MNNISTLFLDLDGTITDPQEGILNSIHFALKRMNITEKYPDELIDFIGPPLRQNFKERYDLSDNDSDKIVMYYREYFGKSGLFENELYPGVRQTLKELKNREIGLFVATSKPTMYAEKILRYFGLDSYFSEIVGSNLNNTMTEKTEIIAHIINKYNLEPEDIAMVGDRKYDIIGAKNNNVRSVVANYGYGAESEFTALNPDFVINNFETLLSLPIYE